MIPTDYIHHELPITQIRHALLVVELGGYHLAAERAARSQSAVTKSIQALESRLGAELFEPSRRTALTPFGQMCLPHLQELLAHHDRTLDAVKSIANFGKGRLTIATISTVASNILPMVISDYISEFPNIELRVIDDNSENIEKMLLNHEIDFGLCSQISLDEKIEFEVVHEDTLGVVCSTNHPAASSLTMNWSDLAGLKLIGTTAHRQMDAYPEKKWLANPFIYVETLLSLMALLYEGVGVSVLGERAIPAYMRDRLAFVPLVNPIRKRSIGIARLSNHSLSPAAQQMLRKLRDAMRVPRNYL